jgi:hypothetical protein
VETKTVIHHDDGPLNTPGRRAARV